MATSSLSLDDVQAAARRICGLVLETPLLEAPLLNDVLGFRLLVKAECLQPTGAFKLRGALNNILQLSDEEKRRGVFAASAGNHAQGLAKAAQMFGVRATILMPHDAPKLKIDNTRAYGAEILFYNRDSEDRDAISRKIMDERGSRMIHAYNDLRTIAGQGSAGLDIHRQSRDLGATPDVILVNCSGGGLASGIALTRELYAHPPQIYTAEPEEFDDARRSLESGSVVGNAKTNGSICDALLVPKLGDLTFPILQQHKVRGLTASDAEVQAAMSLAADHFKLVLEPGGAAALATACRNRAMFKGQVVVVVASGGNVDSENYARHLEQGARHRRQIWGCGL